MAWKYNPFTDALDKVGSGGGSYIDGEVEYHSNLPVTVGTPAVNSAFLVRKGEGLYFISRKPAGIWVRELNNGNLDDWKYAGTFSDLYRDANFRIISDSDVSKQLAFSLSGITTGTTRTITVPDANVTLPDQGTSTTSTPEFARLGLGEPASATSSCKLTVLGTSDISPAAIIKGAQWFGSVDGNQGVLYQGDVAGKVKVIALNSAFSQYKTLELVSDGHTFTFPANGGQLLTQAGAQSTYSDTPTGANGAVEITADYLGVAGDNISLSFDGTDDVDTVVAAWNAANPSNTATVSAGGSEIPDNGETVTLSGGADPTFASYIHGHGNLTSDGKVGSTSGLPLKTGTDGVVQAGAFGTSAGQFAEGNHTHGNLTNDGKIGSDSGRVLVTTTAGAVTTLALGTAGQVLTVNGTADGVEFAAASGGGVTGAAASASDVLGVSGSNITGVDATADRIVFWDDSASALKYLEVSTGLSISGTTLTATGGGGGSKTYAVFSAEHNQPPSTAFATLDTRNSIAVLDFDAATDENAVFVGIMPEAASLGSGLIVRLHWMATSATSGNVRWGVQFERSNTDLDADSFDTAVEATSATNGTSGIITTTAITVTTIDGITAGDVFRLKVYRNADDATNDTMTGDAELVAVEVRSAA